MRLKHFLFGLLGVVIVACAGFFAIAWKSAIAPIRPPDRTSFDQALIHKGAMLAAVGNCTACHTQPGGRSFAGSFALPTPFGTIYSSNITPDPETGIGTWSEAAAVTLIVTGFQVSRLLHRQEDASTMDANDRISNSFKTIATWLERILALVILGGVAVFGLSSAQTLLAMSWGQTDTFYELIYRVLLLVIAIELVRTLVTHDLRAILELLAFVVARKMLKPDLNVIDIVLCVLAFVALLAANCWWLSPSSPQGSDGSDVAP